MKKFSSLKTTFAALSLACLGACSGPVYTLAPGTGAYHGTEKMAKTETPQAEPVAYAATASANPETAAPLANPQTEASAALAQALTARENTTSAEAVTHTNQADKKAATKKVKELRQRLKEYKKDVNDSHEAQTSVNKTAIVLILIGLILAILGGGSLLGALGAIFIVVGLILILLDIL